VFTRSNKPDATAGAPALRLWPSDINNALEKRSRAWIRRHALAAALAHRGAGILAVLSVFVIAAIPFATPIARSLVMPRDWVFAVMAASAAGFLIATSLVWRSTYRWAMPSLLLQLDRCGCCGNPLASPHEDTRAIAAIQRGVRCSECGAEWSSGLRIGHVETSIERYCDAA
jgi:hypothetical protein